MDGAVTAGDGGREFGNVSIDTRTLQPGDFYVARPRRALRRRCVREGAAIEAGAGGVRGAARWRGEGDVSAETAVVIEVDDTTVALQALAHGIRRESGTKVVAITGSAGKTTTKEVTSDFSRRGTAWSATAGISTTTSGCRCRSWT